MSSLATGGSIASVTRRVLSPGDFGRIMGVSSRPARHPILREAHLRDAHHLSSRARRNRPFSSYDVRLTNFCRLAPHTGNRGVSESHSRRTSSRPSWPLKRLWGWSSLGQRGWSRSRNSVARLRHAGSPVAAANDANATAWPAAPQQRFPIDVRDSMTPHATRSIISRSSG